MAALKLSFLEFNVTSIINATEIKLFVVHFVGERRYGCRLCFQRVTQHLVQKMEKYNIIIKNPILPFELKKKLFKNEEKERDTRFNNIQTYIFLLCAVSLLVMGSPQIPTLLCFK